MITQFAVRLLCGMSGMWCLMPRSQVTSGFFRIQMLVTLGLSVLAGLTWSQFPPAVTGETPVLSAPVGIAAAVVLAILSFLGSVCWTLERRRAGTRAAFAVAAVSTGVLLLASSRPGDWTSGPGQLRLLSELVTAGVLGGATVGMLLGHWYLTAPTMSTRPLNRLNGLFAGFVVARLIVSSIGLALAPDAFAESHTYWTWLTLRWVAGILGPLLVAWMVWRILKYGNTQSATGVLFVGVILCFIGELTAALLYQELGVTL